MELLGPINDYNEVQVKDGYIKADSSGYGHTRIGAENIESVHLKRASLFSHSKDITILQFIGMYIGATLLTDYVSMTVVLLNLQVGLGVFTLFLIPMILTRLFLGEVIVQTTNNVYRFKHKRSKSEELIDMLE